MKQGTKKFSTHDLLPIAHEIIQAGGKVQITVSGNSMRPFIAGNRDKVIIGGIKTLKKGDVILYKNKYGEYILHRIYKLKDMKYKTIGDYCLQEDGQVEQADIIGVVKVIIRKGRKISCNSALWQLYSQIWLALLPVRRYLIAAHIAYIKAKAWIKPGVSFILYSCMTLIRNKKGSGRRGWLSQDD